MISSVWSDLYEAIDLGDGGTLIPTCSETLSSERATWTRH